MAFRRKKRSHAYKKRRTATKRKTRGHKQIVSGQIVNGMAIVKYHLPRPFASAWPDVFETDCFSEIRCTQLTADAFTLEPETIVNTAANFSICPSSYSPFTAATAALRLGTGASQHFTVLQNYAIGQAPSGFVALCGPTKPFQYYRPVNSTIDVEMVIPNGNDQLYLTCNYEPLDVNPASSEQAQRMPKNKTITCLTYANGEKKQSNRLTMSRSIGSATGQKSTSVMNEDDWVALSTVVRPNNYESYNFWLKAIQSGYARGGPINMTIKLRQRFRFEQQNRLNDV